MEQRIEDATPPAWMVQVTHVAPHARGALSGAECDGLALAEAVWGVPLVPPEGQREGMLPPYLLEPHGSTLDLNSGLIAFAYLWRRFGPPWWGSDDNKDLVRYILGTPHPEVWLSLSLSASPLPYGVGYVLAPSLQTALQAPSVAWERAFKAWWLRTYASAEDRNIVASAESTPMQRHTVAERYADARWATAIVDEAEAALGPYPREECSPVICEAIAAALRELLRPVFIRDVAINILGCVPDAALATHGEEADYSAYAGYGVPKEAMDAQMKKGEDGE